MTLKVGGASAADHLAVVAKAMNKAPNGAELPPHAGYLWNTFVELSSCRAPTGFGSAPISFSEIDAYRRMKRTSLLPWEVDAIRALDEAFIQTGSRNKVSNMSGAVENAGYVAQLGFDIDTAGLTGARRLWSCLPALWTEWRMLLIAQVPRLENLVQPSAGRATMLQRPRARFVQWLRHWRMLANSLIVSQGTCMRCIMLQLLLLAEGLMV